MEKSSKILRVATVCTASLLSITFSIFASMSPSFSANLIDQVPGSIIGSWVQRQSEDERYCIPGKVIIRSKVILHYFQNCDDEKTTPKRLRIKEIIEDKPWFFGTSVYGIVTYDVYGLTTYVIDPNSDKSPSSIFVYVTDPEETGSYTFGTFYRQ